MCNKFKRGIAFTLTILLATKSLPLYQELPQIGQGEPKKKERASCDCSQSSFDQSNSPLGQQFPSEIQQRVGDEAQTILVDAQDSVSSVCGAADGTSYCGPRQIAFFDLVTQKQVTKWPHKGISWVEKNNTLIIKPTSDLDVGTHSMSMKVAMQNFPQVSQTVEFRYDVIRTSDPITDHVKDRKLAVSVAAVIPGSSTAEEFCLIPNKGLNLLTTNVKASQSSFFDSISSTPKKACDGITNNQGISSQLFMTGVEKTSSPFLKLEFPTSTLVQTVLILEREGSVNTLKTYLLYCGDNADMISNNLCSGQLSSSVGGWSTCGLTGKYFWVKAPLNSYMFFPEIMLYSQEEIHGNASWANIDYIDPFYWNNGVRSASVVIAAASQTTYCIKSQEKTTALQYRVQLGNNVLINGVTIIGSSDPTWQNAQKNLDVYVQDIILNTPEQKCGTIADYNSYQEIGCNMIGSVVMFRIAVPNTFLGFCSIGILVPESSCICSNTSFNPTLFTSKQSSILTATTMTAGQTVSPKVNGIADVISRTCGNGDGRSKCPHTTRFYLQISGVETEITSWPYKSLSYFTNWGGGGVFAIIDVNPADQTNVYVIRVVTEISALPTIQTASQVLTVTMAPIFCKVLNTVLSLIKTDSKPAISSVYSDPHSDTPITGCDGIIYQERSTDVIHTRNNGFFRVELLNENPIQTVMFEHRTDGFQDRLLSTFITVGNNMDITMNDICVPLQSMTTSGWFSCPKVLIGKFVGFYSSNFLSFQEVNAFSFPVIQGKAIKTSFYGNDQLGFEALKAITFRIVPDNPPQNIPISLVPAPGQPVQPPVYPGYPDTCCMTNLVNDPKFSMEWADRYIFKSIILIPSQNGLNIPYETNVQVFIQDGTDPENYCGLIPAYNIYFELNCEKPGTKIILKKAGTSVKLVFCSIGVIATLSPLSCSCEDTTFSALKPFLSISALTMKTSERQTIVKLNSQIDDNVSMRCGLKDGYSQCGPRTFTFYDRSAGVTVLGWPYKGWTFDKVSQNLTVIPSNLCLGTNEIDVSIVLENFPLSTQLTQRLTITILDDQKPLPPVPDPCTSSSIVFSVLAETSYTVTLTQFLDSPIKLKAPPMIDSYSKQLGFDNSCGPFQFKAYLDSDAAKLVTYNSVTSELTFNTNVAGFFPDPVTFKLLGQFKNYKNQSPVLINYQYTYLQCKVDKVEPLQGGTDFELVVDGTVQEVKISDWGQSPNCGYQIQSFTATGSTYLIKKTTDRSLYLVSKDTTLNLKSEYPIRITPVFDVGLPVLAIQSFSIKVTLALKLVDETNDEDMDQIFAEEILTQLEHINDQNSNQTSSRTGKDKVVDDQPALMSIKKFSDNGLLTLVFSKPIIVLDDPKVLLKRVKIPSPKRQLQSAVSVPNLQVTATIDVDNPNGYSTVVSIKNMTELTLEVQVNFTAPLNVSSSEIPDFLSVHLWNTKRILTKANQLPVQLSTTPLQIKIPRQLSGTKGETSLLAASEASGEFASKATIASAALSFFVNLGANQILAQITGLNYICNLTCVNLKYPAVVMAFMATLLQFVTFDVIDTDPVYNSMLGLDSTEPLTQNFDATGYSSGECIRILGSMFLFQTATLLLAAIGRLFLKGNQKYQRHWKLPKKAVRIIKKQVDAILWNGTIQFFNQNYMLLAIASLINHSQTDYNGYHWLTFNNLVSLCILLSLFAVPILLFSLTFINFEEFKIKDSAKNKRWGYHLQGIRIQRDMSEEVSVVRYALNDHKLSKLEAILAAFFDYPRQLAFCATLVYLRDHPWGQLMIVNFLSIFNMIFIAIYRPYEDPKLNNSKIVGEVVVITYLTLSRCYTDWVPDPMIRQLVGFTQITVVILQIVQVLISFFFNSNLTFEFKKTFYGFKHRWIQYRSQLKKQKESEQVVAPSQEFEQGVAAVPSQKFDVEKVLPKKYQTDVSIHDQQEWQRQFVDRKSKSVSNQFVKKTAADGKVTDRDSLIIPQKTKITVQTRLYSDDAISKMIQSFQPKREDQQLVNQIHQNKIKEEFPLGLNRDELVSTLRQKLQLCDPEKKAIDVSDFDLTQEEMKFCSFEQVKNLCQNAYDDLAQVNNSNFLDAEIHLTEIKTESWPFGLKHLLSMYAGIELDPFDYSFMKTLPQEYQDLSEDARRRYIINCILQQFYQLGNESLNEANEQAIAYLDNCIKPDIVKIHRRLNIVMDQINRFRSSYRKGHNSRLALINNQLSTWPLQRLESFAVKITKCKRNWYFKNEIQQSVQIQLDIFSVIQTID